MTTTQQQTSTTVAAALAANPVIDGAIERIVAELEQHQAAITGTCDPLDGQGETLDAYLQRQAEVKGRGGFFPYVGSGIGRGPLVELLDGSIKWDLINGIGVHMFGHSDPDLVRTALRASLGDTVMQGNLQFNAEAVDFGAFLIEQASKARDGVAGGDSGIRHCFLTNSGAMANESALKVCFQRTAPACRVIAFQDCFMGRSTTMAQIGDNAGGRVGLPLNTLVDYMPFYDPDDPERSTAAAIDQLKQHIARYPKQHACFAMELIQGEGGFNTAPASFFEPLMQLCKDNGIAVWIDEVQTFGRTTEMFAFQKLGLGTYVDVVTIGKMSHVCAAMFTEAYNPQPGLLSGTFIGDTVGLNVGRRALQRLRDGGYYGDDGHIARLQEAFRTRAQALVDAHPDWFVPVPHASGGTRKTNPHVGGVGGMMRITPFGGDRKKINQLVQALFKRGVISFYCGHGPYHLRFLAPVGVMRPEQFDGVFEIVEHAMADVAGAS